MALVSLTEKSFPLGTSPISVNQDNVLTLFREDYGSGSDPDAGLIVLLIREFGSDEERIIYLEETVHGNTDADLAVVASLLGFASFTEKLFPTGERPFYINPEKIIKISLNEWDGVIITYEDLSLEYSVWVLEDISTVISIANISLDPGSQVVSSFTYSPSPATINLPVSFTDTSTNSPTMWSWSFGDGNISNQQNPTHSYNATGSQVITLTSSNSGSSSTATNSINISAPSSPPIASFSYSPNTGFGARGYQVDFTDTSTNSPNQWLWDFGNGNQSSQQNPTHIFEYTGNFNNEVKLTAFNSFGSDQSVSVYFNITGLPTSNNMLAVTDSVQAIYNDTINSIGSGVGGLTNTSTSAVMNPYCGNLLDHLDYAAYEISANSLYMPTNLTATGIFQSVSLRCHKQYFGWYNLDPQQNTIGTQLYNPEPWSNSSGFFDGSIHNNHQTDDMVVEISADGTDTKVDTVDGSTHTLINNELVVTGWVQENPATSTSAAEDIYYQSLAAGSVLGSAGNFNMIPGLLLPGGFHQTSQTETFTIPPGGKLTRAVFENIGVDFIIFYSPDCTIRINKTLYSGVDPWPQWSGPLPAILPSDFSGIDQDTCLFKPTTDSSSDTDGVIFNLAVGGGFGGS